MLIVAVRIFRLLIVKGTKCCLNCLIILYTKNWPNPETTDITIKSTENSICSHMNTRKGQPSRVTMVMTATIIVHHLLISAIISVGSGLKFTLISACKSGKNPYATKWNNRNRIPMNYCLSYLYLVYGSAN